MPLRSLSHLAKFFFSTLKRNHTESHWRTVVFKEQVPTSGETEVSKMKSEIFYLFADDPEKDAFIRIRWKFIGRVFDYFIYCPWKASPKISFCICIKFNIYAIYRHIIHDQVYNYVICIKIHKSFCIHHALLFFSFIKNAINWKKKKSFLTFSKCLRDNKTLAFGQQLFSSSKI